MIPETTDAGIGEPQRRQGSVQNLVAVSCRFVPLWGYRPDRHGSMVGNLITTVLTRKMIEGYPERGSNLHRYRQHDILSLGIGSGKTAQAEVSAKRTSKA